MRVRKNENNKFGRLTWIIEIDVHLHLLIHESNSSSFLVEFKELFIIAKKTHFSFISNSSLKETICKSFDEVYNYFTKNKKYSWPVENKKVMLQNALELIISDEQHYLQLKYNIIKEFFESQYSNFEYKENNDELKFLMRDSNAQSAIVYTIKEDNKLALMNFSLFNAYGLFVKSWKYQINSTQFAIIDDYKQNLKEIIIKINKKKAEEILNDFYDMPSEKEESFEAFEFEDVSWEMNIDLGKIVITFTSKSGETKIFFKDCSFDFGDIYLIDCNKTINEIISDIKMKDSFALLDKGGVVFSNYLGQILIKGWGLDEFIDCQNQLKIERERTKDKKNNNLSVVGFFNRNQEYALKLCSLNFTFSEALIERYRNIIDWDYLSSNENIIWSSELINKYLYKWNWQGLSSNKSLPWSLDFYERFEDKFSLLEMSTNPKVPWNKNIFEKLTIDEFALDYACYSGNHHWVISFIEQVADIIIWESFCTNENINWSKDIVDRFSDKICWEELSRNRSLVVTTELFEKYKSYFNMNLLFNNEAFWANNELRKKYIEHFPWDEASSFQKFNWSNDFIDDNKMKFNWWRMSSNQSLPWNLEFYEKYKDLISLNALSSNSNFPWSEIFIEKNKNKFNWNKEYIGLSNNEGLPWSQRFIEKYEDLWEFGKYSNESIYDGIGNRINIPWDIELLLRFENKWDYKILIMNHSIWDKAFSKYDRSLVDLFLSLHAKN